jgi:hypothetical protein
MPQVLTRVDWKRGPAPGGLVPARQELGNGEENELKRDGDTGVIGWGRCGINWFLVGPCRISGVRGKRRRAAGFWALEVLL